MTSEQREKEAGEGALQRSRGRGKASAKTPGRSAVCLLSVKDCIRGQAAGTGGVKGTVEGGQRQQGIQVTQGLTGDGEDFGKFLLTWECLEGVGQGRDVIWLRFYLF